MPPAIEQLGAKLTFIEQDELAWGDLSKYDVIMTGVRAYERRADLRAYNRRLLDYAERGGTVIVQYNKFEFNQAQYGPFPAKVSGNRVIGRNGAGEGAGAGCIRCSTTRTRSAGDVEQTGCRSAACISSARRIAKYVDLVSMTDSFKDNPGEKLGSLVEAQRRQGPLDLSGPRIVAAAAGGHGWRVSVAGEPDQPAEGARGHRGALKQDW